MRGLEEPGPRPTTTGCGCVKPALETGNLLTEPIGYLESCFSTKNGTPRQPSICSHSRACLKIRKSIFNNPEHSLMGLEHFSHVWILFVFHKNGHLSCKAKVQPPRLNGAKTGVFSTRSPHRPNAIGLTLAKLERVEGGTVYLSGIDMIHGTPVLDIKPYIADYDSPQSLVEPLGNFDSQYHQHKPHTEFQPDSKTASCNQQQLSGWDEAQPHSRTEENLKYPGEARTSGRNSSKHDETANVLQYPPKHRELGADLGVESRGDQSSFVAGDRDSPCHLEKSTSEGSVDKSHPSGREAAATPGKDVALQGPPPPPSMAEAARSSAVPAWVREAPVTPLEVRFTPHAARDLGHLSSEDTAHVTCWFGDGFAEVLRIKPASEPVPVTDPVESLVSLGS
ncbi:PREDICTED: nef-associated protein 1 isoform X2 [Condylura cristata]|uniref:nef-associated protein 1 isoform X2 n=1 Tax=Condylura cristata TaxID=143302 RepID=UPI0006439485|nr:PREDICTED: nef-associated protein 1 isoform X2 [Condylura cristata]